MVISAVILLLLSLAGPAVAEGLPTTWVVPDSTHRIVFTAERGSGDEVLVEAPFDEPGGAKGPFSAFDPQGVPLPCRDVYSAPGRASWIVGLRAPSGGQWYSIYCGGGGGPVDAAPRISLPVSVEVLQIEGWAIPTTWERMRYMASRARRQGERAYHPSFEHVNLPAETGKRKRKSASTILLQSAFVLCRTGGVYRFAVDCDDSGFLCVDGVLAAEWPGEHAGGQWREGPPAALEPGLHLLEFYTCSASAQPESRVGWRPPGAAGPGPIPPEALFTASRPGAVRVERVDRTLHPAFSSSRRPAYGFRGSPAVFTPVEFSNLTADWMPGVVRYRWDFGDGSTGEDRDPVHVYSRLGRFSVTLEARDSLGFSRRWTGVVDCRDPAPIAYALRAEVVLLPAACYATDTVSPHLRINSDFPRPAQLDGTCETRTRGGESSVFETTAELANGERQTPIVAGAAGALESIRWSIRHQGVAVAEGGIDFLQPPFSRAPVRVTADRLYDSSGVQLVLVPSCFWEPGAPAPPQMGAGGRLQCIDDTLGFPDLVSASAVRFDRLLRGGDGDGVSPEVQHVQLADWSGSPESYGPLLKLVEVPARIDPASDVIVLSIGMRDIAAGVPPDAFERQIAALTDIALAGGRNPLIWMTPPPWPGDPDRTRPFAAAIAKVAETRGVPVADLYSAFLCAPAGGDPLLAPGQLALSSAGQTLAAKTIAHALLAEPVEIETWQTTRSNSVSESPR